MSSNLYFVYASRGAGETAKANLHRATGRPFDACEPGYARIEIEVTLGGETRRGMVACLRAVRVISYRRSVTTS